MKIVRSQHLTRFALQTILTYVRLVIMNRWYTPSHAGTVRLFGKKITYPKRGSLHGMYKEIFLKKNYYIDETDEPITIIDCGSNIGISVLYFLLRAPSAHIISFEPNPHTFAILKENVAQNKFAVELHNAGVSNTSGSVTFYTDSEDTSSQSASVTRHLDTKSRPLVPMTVQMERLADILTRPVDVLKLDIEGAEGEVIEDLAITGKLVHVQKLFIEYHYDGTNTVYPFGKLLRHIEEAGFVYVIETGITFPYYIPKKPQNYSYKIIAWKK